MEIAIGELLDSERVDEGDDDCDVHDVVGDLIISRFNLYARPPPLKQEDICGLNQERLEKNSIREELDRGLSIKNQIPLDR